MSKVPELPYNQIVAALKRDGRVVVRQKGSHLQLRKRTATQNLRITLAAHRPVLRQSLAKLLKDAQIDLDHFLDLLR